MNSTDIAKNVFRIESNEVLGLSDLLTKDFENAINAIFNSTGKLIISGMGKSGIIGKKIAASLASTGTPSFFLHPGEAYHGDLGMIESDDILLLISNSGETDEVLKIIPFLRSNNNSVIAMSGNPDSTLAKNSNFHLNIAVKQEACPLQLAPTSSTTTTLVMGDAIVVALMDKRDFKPENFAKYHPGGSLGKMLLTNVSDLMSKKIPLCDFKDNITDVIHAISESRTGVVFVENDSIIVGIITDGDIRRSMNLHSKDIFDKTASEIMKQTPFTVESHYSIVKANTIFSENKVSTLLVMESDEAIGILQQHNTL